MTLWLNHSDRSETILEYCEVVKRFDGCQFQSAEICVASANLVTDATLPTRIEHRQETRNRRFRKLVIIVRCVRYRRAIDGVTVYLHTYLGM